MNIREQIAVEGPVPFERFMELALYGPAGFFTTGPLRSEKGGDFLTSPEVSPMFGVTLGEYVEREHRRIGEPFHVIEIGAGSGALLRPLLERIAVEVWAVELSPAARSALAEVLPSDRVVADADGVPAPWRGVVIANELLDNLPMAIAQLSNHGWRERWVGVEGDGLALFDHDPRPEVAIWLERFAGQVDVGGWVEVQLAAGEWLRSTLKRLTAGSVVLFDYGDTAENLVPRRRDGTLRTYRSHHLGPHPLDEPGATDITADVNFTALMAVASESEAIAELHRQDDFLAALGLRQKLSELRRRELEFARGPDHQARLEIRSQVKELETLLHPRGLGDFRVLEILK